jgi:ribosome-binding factor A
MSQKYFEKKKALEAARFEAISGGVSNSSDGKKKRRSHKDHQLCKQVQRALYLAFCEERQELILQDLEITRVEPAPDSTHLMIWLASPRANATPAEILSAVRRVAPRLRSEVATAIHRKKVPQLDFCLANLQPEE